MNGRSMRMGMLEYLSVANSLYNRIPLGYHG